MQEASWDEGPLKLVLLYFLNWDNIFLLLYVAVVVG